MTKPENQEVEVARSVGGEKKRVEGVGLLPEQDKL